MKDIPNAANDLPFVENILSGIAKYISLIAIKTPLSGAAITFISLISALIAAGLAISQHFILSFAFFSLYILLDHVDGQVARFKGESGKSGIYLDSRVHFIAEPAYLLSLGIGASGINGSMFFVASIAAPMFYLMRQTMKTGDLGDAGIRSMKNESGFFGKINYFVFDFVRINNPFGLLLWAVMFGFIKWAVCVYALLFGINAFYSFLKTWNNLKKS